MPASPQALDEAALATFEIDGLRVAAPASELWALKPGWESVTRRMILGELPVGGVLVDVGAHVGTIALAAARHVGPSGRIHAIEASPESARILSRNLEANRLGNVELHCCAAGAAPARRTFHLMGYSYLNGLWAHPGGEARGTIEVEVRPVDELVEGRVDVVKIDVEGGELEVLEGMRRVVRENPGLAVCVEWNPLTLRSRGADPMELIDRLAELSLQPSFVVDESHHGRMLELADAWAAVASASDVLEWGNLFAYGPARSNRR